MTTETSDRPRRLVYACDSCDFTLVDPSFVDSCAVVPAVTCRCGKRMRSLGMQPGEVLAEGRKCAQCRGGGEVVSRQVDEDGDECPPVLCPRCGGSGIDPLRTVNGST